MADSIQHTATYEDLLAVPDTLGLKSFMVFCVRILDLRQNMPLNGWQLTQSQRIKHHYQRT